MNKMQTGRWVNQSLAHDSAHLHVSGEAVYVDDIPEPPGTLQVYIATSPHAHARILSMDLGAVRAAPGVAGVFTAADLEGLQDDTVEHPFEEPVFAGDEVQFHGHGLFAVAAKTMAQARAAAKLAKVEYQILEAVLTLDDAIAEQSFLSPTQTMKRGNAEQAVEDAAERLSGTINIGGQEHFYLEGHVSLAIPGENDDIVLHTSTQDPTEVQFAVANVLGCPAHSITVKIRRLGGGFGGKELQAAPFAIVASLVAIRTRRPAKVRLDRDDDMRMTGKRHEFRIGYDVGFDSDGRIEGIELDLASRCGNSPDSSDSINDRAMRHVDNAYYLPNVSITSHRYRTHTVSNTAFRGFGVPQAMLGIERVMEEIAFHLGLDPLQVRLANLYGEEGRNITPYNQSVEDNLSPQIIEQLERDCRYRERRSEIREFNATSKVLKKGIALTPIKFGIAFSVPVFNQGGALVHVYADGSVQLNHGGTEMGQGLFIKVAQIVAEEFQIDVERVKITATNTGKVPNTSASAASSSCDINGAAARNAAREIRDRMTDFLVMEYGVQREEVVFNDNRVNVGNAAELSFPELARMSYNGQVQLSAAGFYRIPKVHFDRSKHQGRPYHYFVYGAAVSEVLVDTLTGEYRITRSDILYDAGRSLNPAIDLGQVEGGFMQGVGMLTTEELWWDDQGCLRTHAPSTYKIPVCSDRPTELNIKLLGEDNREQTVHRSKGIGEPPLLLAISVLHAISDAVASVADYGHCPRIDTPATPERVLDAVDAMFAIAEQPSREDEMKERALG